MTWARIDDGFHSHPKRHMVSLTADGLLSRALSYAAHYLTDGFVPESWLEQQIPRRQRRAVIAEITKPLGPYQPLFERVEGGYMIHDFLDCNPSRTELEGTRGRDARKKALHRDRELIAAVRARDLDHCRYCDRPVDWKDRRGTLGGTYDHLNPFGDNGIENIVVACRGCNGFKGQRTPTEAGMPLRPARGAQLNLAPDLDPSQVHTYPHGSGVGEEPQPTEEQPEDHAPAPDDLRSRYPWPLGEVLHVLSKVDRWAQVELYAAGIESIIAAEPGKAPVKGAHLTAARGNDPGFRTQSPIKAFSDVMVKLDRDEDKPAGSTGQNVLRIDRRCRRCRVREVKAGYGAYCEQCSEELAS